MDGIGIKIDVDGKEYIEAKELYLYLGVKDSYKVWRSKYRIKGNRIGLTKAKKIATSYNSNAGRNLAIFIDEWKNIKLPNRQARVDTSDSIMSLMQSLALEEMRDIEELYKEMLADIKEMLDNVFYNATKDMTLEEQIKFINSAMTLDEQIRFNTGGYGARISRLTWLQTYITEQCKSLGATVESSLTKYFSNIVSESYNRFIFGVQKDLGLGFSYKSIPERTLKAVLSKPFAGQNFKGTVKRNYSILGSTLREELFKGLHEGVSPYVMASRIKHKTNVGSLNHIRTTVRTETTNFCNQGQIMGLQELGVDKYMFVATLDSRTSTVCQEMDGKVFETKKAIAGVNLPPMHFNCRSTTVAYFDDSTLTNFKRRARDPKTGRNYVLDKYMEYKDWVKEFNK